MFRARSCPTPALLFRTPAPSFLARPVQTDGGYQFLQVPPGTYTLEVKCGGFREYRETRLQLLVNLPATSNVTLQVGSINETIEVSSEAPPLNMVDATLGAAFGEQQVKQLPLEIPQCARSAHPTGGGCLYRESTGYQSR